MSGWNVERCVLLWDTGEYVLVFERYKPGSDEPEYDLRKSKVNATLFNEMTDARKFKLKVKHSEWQIQPIRMGHPYH